MTISPKLIEGAKEHLITQSDQYQPMLRSPAFPELLDTLPDHVWPVLVELEGAPRPKKPRLAKDEMRSFIVQQMLDAKDEAALASCARYMLWNGLV